jgi:methyltransferase (TIGR00027 family)/deazaflavin-dependent oxidoreductase (nitroreductase family)
MNRHGPGRLARKLLRAPARLYDWHAGWLLGRRFLRLTHVGRRSGRLHQTVLEVIGTTTAGDVVVIAGFGPTTDWYRNVCVGPAVEVAIGRRRFRPAVRTVDQREAFDVVARYEHHHRWVAPVIRRVLSSLLGWRYDGSDDARRGLVRQLPMLAFRPADAPLEQAGAATGGRNVQPTGARRARRTTMARQAARTAIGPMALVAGEQYRDVGERLVDDPLAYKFLPTGVRWVVALTRWRPCRELLVSATEAKGRGLAASLLCRKRYVADRLDEAARDGIDALVVLGAGLDTLAYRHPAPARAVFEVDLPENIADKEDKVSRVLGRIPDPVTLVPIDFETQQIDQVLASAGYDPEARTFFVWEGVTQYLTERAARTTMRALANAATGSRLVFTYVRQDFLDGTHLYAAEPAYQEFKVKRRLWQFGLDPEQVGAFLAEYGWHECEQVGAEEFDAWYVQPTGRGLPVSEIERSVYAEKA